MHAVQEKRDVELIPTALDTLSPHHSAVFLFGCQVTQLLANCPLFPSVHLLLATSLPVPSTSSNDPLLAHCSGDFYFDATNQILYVSEAKLQHAGHFIAIIVQAMAFISSGNWAMITSYCVMYTSIFESKCVFFKSTFFFLSSISTPELYASSSRGCFISKPSAVHPFVQMEHSRGV